MTFQRKIVGWFVVFGALTIILFGIGDYLQSTYALRATLDARAAALAAQVGGDISRRYDQVEAELLRLGFSMAVGQSAVPPRLQGRYAEVRVFRGDSAVYRAATLGQDTVAAPGCATGMVPITVAFTQPNGLSYRIEAQMPADIFFAGVPSAGSRLGRHGFNTVFRASTGSLVFDANCALSNTPDGTELQAMLAARAMTAGDAASVSSNESGPGRWILATTDGTVPDWMVVVGLDHASFAAPFLRLRQQYFGLVSAVVLLALGLMLLGVRRDMRRLSAIANAADAIGHGRFDVWLPPPVGDEIGRVSLALGRMMDRLSSTLRQMEVSRSMAALGELSAYLSHEIRNPLSSIRLNLQMLRRDLRTGGVPADGEQLVALCLSELQRLDDVVKTVLEIGRTGRGAKGSCNAHAAVHDTLRIMQSKLKERGLEVSMRLEAADADVAMASAALRGVIMNLLINSIDALAERPAALITIASRLVYPAGMSEPRFELRVTDNGPGVPAHLRERIFDPFFTTKPTGNGIGLATALSVVQECGGVLRFEPAAWGTGADFVLELQLAEVPAEPEANLVGAGA